MERDVSTRTGYLPTVDVERGTYAERRRNAADKQTGGRQAGLKSWTKSDSLPDLAEWSRVN
jgi:hypothetical protein